MIADRLKGRRNSSVETAIARALRAMKPLDAAHEIIHFLRQENAGFNEVARHQLGLILSNRVLRDRCSCLQVLEEGLKIGDASSIQFWLAYLHPRLGWRRILRCLIENGPSRKMRVEFALYWMGKYSAEIKRQKLDPQLDRLKALVKGYE